MTGAAGMGMERAARRGILPVCSCLLLALAVGRAQPPAPGATLPAPPPPDSQPEVAPAEGQAQAAAIRFGSPAAPAKAPGTIRIASYNVENLFDAEDDPLLSGRYEDMESVKPEAQLRGVAAAIRALDADVVALAEVESEKVLLWFRDTYLKDLGYGHAASLDAGDERGIEQGVLSRYPITATDNWAHQLLGGLHPANVDAPEGTPIVFHRSPLLVDIKVPAREQGATDYEFSLLVMHMKSGGRSGYWREAEATRTVELVLELEAARPGRNILVLGDFNSTPNDRSLRTLVNPLTGRLIDLLADRPTPGTPGAERFVTHESGRTVDYILCNKAMEPEVTGTRFILGTPARPAGVDWRTYPPPEGYGSDHYPVVVDIVAREGGAAEREGSVKAGAEAPE